MITRTTDGTGSHTTPVQPELPLGTRGDDRRPPRRTGGLRTTRPRRTARIQSAVRNDLDEDGRIDEHTRAVGMQGIAAARRRLAASTAASEGRVGPAGGLDPARSRRADGRAA
jgi:hypothetical protein